MRKGKSKFLDIWMTSKVKFIILYKRIMLGRVSRKKQCEKALWFMHQV